jgi:ferrous iron transport protein B
MAATGVFHKEVGQWRWTLFFVGFTTGTAYVFSFLVFTIGKLLI